METTLLEMLKDVEMRCSYLHRYWYTLKYFVCGLHAVYRLLFKVLTVFGSSSMVSKLKCHNLENGPRPIGWNLEFFKELVVFTQIQIQIIGPIVRGKLNPDIQDTISQIFFQLTKFLNNMIWFYNRTGNVLHNGWPVQMHFIWFIERIKLRVNMYLFIVLDCTEFTVQHVTLVTFGYVCFKQQRLDQSGFLIYYWYKRHVLIFHQHH